MRSQGPAQHATSARAAKPGSVDARQLLGINCDAAGREPAGRVATAEEATNHFSMKPAFELARHVRMASEERA
jgi:hypothetical protein